MHVDVAVAGARLDGRHLRVLHAGPDEPRPAARDEDVHEADGPEELGGLRVLRVVVDVGDGVAGQPLAKKRLAAERGDGGARARSGGTALEQARVARAQAERERVGRHVGPRLVDHGHDAQGNRDLLDAQAVRVHVPADHPPERVGLGRHVLHRGGDGAHAGLVEHEAVEEPLAHAGGAGGGHVGLIRLDDLRRIGAQEGRRPTDGGRTGRRRRRCDLGCRRMGQTGLLERFSHTDDLQPRGAGRAPAREIPRRRAARRGEPRAAPRPRRGSGR